MHHSRTVIAIVVGIIFGASTGLGLHHAKADNTVPAPAAIPSGEILAGRMTGTLPGWAERPIEQCVISTNYSTHGPCLVRLADRFSAAALRRWGQYWQALPDNIRAPLLGACGTGQLNSYQRYQCLLNATETLTHSGIADVKTAARRALPHARAMFQNYAAAMQASGQCLVSAAGGDEEKAAQIPHPEACRPPGDLFAQYNPSNIRYVAASSAAAGTGKAAEAGAKPPGPAPAEAPSTAPAVAAKAPAPAPAAVAKAPATPPASTGRPDGTGPSLNPEDRGSAAKSDPRGGSEHGSKVADHRGEGGHGGTGARTAPRNGSDTNHALSFGALFESTARDRRTAIAGCPAYVASAADAAAAACTVPTDGTPLGGDLAAALGAVGEEATARENAPDGGDGDFSNARFFSSMVRLRLEREFKGYRALAERPSPAGSNVEALVRGLSARCGGNPALRDFISSLTDRSLAGINRPAPTAEGGNFGTGMARAAAILRQIDEDNAVLMRDFYDESKPASENLDNMSRFFTEGWGQAIPCQSIIRGGLFIASSINNAVASSAYTGACRLVTGTRGRRAEANTGSSRPTGPVHVTCSAAGRPAAECRSSCRRADGAALTEAERVLMCATLPVVGENGEPLRDQYGLPVYPGNATDVSRAPTTALVQDVTSASDRCSANMTLLEANLARRATILGSQVELGNVMTPGGKPLYSRLAGVSDADTSAVRSEVASSDREMFGTDALGRQISSWCENPRAFADEAMGDPAQMAELLSCGGRASVPVPNGPDAALNDRSLPEYCRYVRRHVRRMCPYLNTASYRHAMEHSPARIAPGEMVGTLIDIGTAPLDILACVSIVGGVVENLALAPARAAANALRTGVVRAAVTSMEQELRTGMVRAVVTGVELGRVATPAEVAYAAGRAAVGGVGRMLAAPVVGVASTTARELAVMGAFTAFGAGMGAYSTHAVREEYANRTARCLGGDHSSCDGLAETRAAMEATETATALAPAIGYAILGLVVPTRIPATFNEVSAALRGITGRYHTARTALTTAEEAFRANKTPGNRRAVTDALSTFRRMEGELSREGVRARGDVTRWLDQEQNTRMKEAGLSTRERIRRRGFVLDERNEPVIHNGRPLRLRDMTPEMARSIVDSAASQAMARRVATAMGRTEVTPELGAFINDMEANFTGSHIPLEVRISRDDVVGTLAAINRGELPAWARHLEEGDMTASGRSRARDAAVLEIAALETLRRKRGLSDADIEARVRRATEEGAPCRTGG